MPEDRVKVLLTFTRRQWKVIERQSPSGVGTNAALVGDLIAQMFAERGIEYPDDLPKPVAVKRRKLK